MAAKLVTAMMDLIFMQGNKTAHYLENGKPVYLVVRQFDFLTQRRKGAKTQRFF
jgi:hypothetical protein